MLRYLTHSIIDRNKWDACVEASPHAEIYMLSWYLDQVCMGWNACVWEENGMYEFCFPILHKSKYGIRYVYQPYFCQQSGPFARSGFDLQKAIPQVWKILKSRFWFGRLNINWAATPHIGLLPTYFKRQTYCTYHLQLSDRYADLHAGYNENRKRALKKAIKVNYEIVESNDTLAMVRHFTKHVLPKVSGMTSYHINLLEEVGKEALQRGVATLLMAKKEDEIAGCGLFLSYKNKLIYLSGSQSPQGAQHGASTLLFDYIIQRHAGTGMVLDFEGSNVESIARFYASFGACKVNYLHVYFRRFFLFP